MQLNWIGYWQRRSALYSTDEAIWTIQPSVRSCCPCTIFIEARRATSILFTDCYRWISRSRHSHYDVRRNGGHRKFIAGFWFMGSSGKFFLFVWSALIRWPMQLITIRKTTAEKYPPPTFLTVVQEPKDGHVPAHRDFREKYFQGFARTQDSDSANDILIP